MLSPSDTIVAVATPPGRGGIGIVRISGPQARGIGRTLLLASEPLRPRHVTLAQVRDDAGQAMDEVLATFFEAPHSYTAEDVLEISMHGSPALLRAVLRAAVRAGARLAEPGEFTLRAYLNGRLDLVQAEAVADLVDAATPLQARVAFDQLEGTLTRAIGEIDAELFDVCARLEASLDFPEEGYHFVGRDDVREVLARVGTRLDELIARARVGRLIRDGRQIAVLGRPNVGKSSLFNWLVGADRAIVAEVPGTTRDLVTESIDFEGIRLSLVDTAGVRVADDEVEREGVVRARKAANVAEAVLVVFDVSQPCGQEDRDVLDHVPDARRLVVLNKGDLGVHPDWAGRVEHAVVVSLKSGAGLDDLRAGLRALLGSEDVAVPRDTPLVTNVRHEALLRRAREAMARTVAAIDAQTGDLSEELVLVDVAEARHALEEVTGRRSTDDLLRHIFERFCIGK